jgi:restriction system protein
LPEEASVLLDKMSGFEFEGLVADILTRLHYGSVEKILYTQDGGRDILVRSPDGLIVVECKHHQKGSIGRPVVQKLHSAAITSKATKGMLVTTGHFTQEALEYARNLAKSGATIEMIDRPILIDMASRAKMTLISGRHLLNVWTYSIPSYSETDRAIATYVASVSSSHPRHPSALLNNRQRIISYRPVYVITYDVHSVFETTVGVVHQETVSKARIILDGNNGRLYNDSIIRFLQSEHQTRFNQPHEDFVGDLPTFKVDDTTLQRVAKETITELHTRTVSYYGRNNQRYTKICTPGERDIYIGDIRQFYLPLFRLEFRLGLMSYHIEGTQASSGRLLSISDNLRLCQLCNERIGKGAILCDVCGRITHSGGILIRSIHGFRCKKCGRTTCRYDGYWRRRYLFLKELLCPSCFEELKKTGTSFRRFDPLS